MLGIGGELRKQFPISFHLSKTSFGQMLLLARLNQTMLTNNAFNGINPARDVEFHFEPFGAKSRLATYFEYQSFYSRRSLVRAAMRPFRVFLQTGGFPWLITSDPFADRVARTSEFTHGRLDSFFTGQDHHLLPEHVSICFHLIKLIIRYHFPIIAYRGFSGATSGGGP